MIKFKVEKERSSNLSFNVREIEIARNGANYIFLKSVSGGEQRVKRRSENSTNYFDTLAEARIFIAQEIDKAIKFSENLKASIESKIQDLKNLRRGYGGKKLR
jgi:hypothetical protein